LAEDPEVVKLGKIAIANEILKAEHFSDLAAAARGLKPALASCENFWGNTFLDIAISATRLDGIKNIFKNVTVIDFNYDRGRRP
jgi:hypothetical protein